MVNNLEMLQPIAGNHSISRVIVSLFAPQKFIKPENIFNTLKEDSSFENYQRKNLITARSINIQNNTFGVSDEGHSGFILEEFDDSGKLKNIFKLENRNDNQGIVSFESRHYTNWESFKKKLLKDIESFSKKLNFYTEAISLIYIDEFIWDSNNEKIDVNSIFNVDSSFLNKKFLGSENGTIISITQHEEDYKTFEEKTEISFNNKVKRITLNHQSVLHLSDVELVEKCISNNSLEESLDKAHIANKDILSDILSINSQKIIGLL